VVGSRRNRGWKNSDSANREASSCAARIAAPILAGGNMPEVNSVQRNSSDMIPTAISPYKTTELELASFLKARSYRLLDARMVGRIVTFEFEQGAAEDVNAYFAGTEVSARELFVSNTEAMSDKAYHLDTFVPLLHPYRLQDVGQQSGTLLAITPFRSGVVMATLRVNLLKDLFRAIDGVSYGCGSRPRFQIRVTELSCCQDCCCKKDCEFPLFGH